jgi:hypothetical protein
MSQGTIVIGISTSKASKQSFNDATHVIMKKVLFTCSGSAARHHNVHVRSPSAPPCISLGLEVIYIYVHMQAYVSKHIYDMISRNDRYEKRIQQQ